MQAKNEDFNYVYKACSSVKATDMIALHYERHQYLPLCLSLRTNMNCFLRPLKFVPFTSPAIIVKKQDCEILRELPKCKN